MSLGARRYAPAILAIVYMFNFIDKQILAILLPAIHDEFQVGDTVLGLLAGTAFAVFLSTTVARCLGLLVLPAIVSNFCLAPVLGQTQSLVSLRSA